MRQPLPAAIALFLSAIVAAASAAPAPGPASSALKKLHSRNDTSAAPSSTFPPSPSLPFDLAEGIKCYALPYGAIGFLSHLLTYWTLGCLYIKLSPWSPWKKLKRWRFDMILGCLSLLSSVILTIITMVRCAKIWPLILIVSWKMSLSLLLCGTSVQVAYEVRGGRDVDFHVELLALYLLGVILGLAGLGELLKSTWYLHIAAIYLIVIVFSVVAAIAIIVAAVSLCSWAIIEGARVAGILAWPGTLVAIISVFFALFSDWVIAGILVEFGQGNWIGVPGGDNQLIYWTYFVAKRLTLFST